LGEEIKFGLSGNAGSVTGKGWGAPSDKHLWNNGKMATLKFSMVQPKSDCKLDAVFIPYVKKGKVEKQRIIVKVKEVVVDEWIAMERKGLSFSTTISKNLITSDPFVITMEFPDAVCPKNIGTGGDSRTLSVAMNSLKLSEVIQ
jgi:hypothetical protein